MTEAEDDRNKIMIFGYNYAKIECFRTCMLHGYAGAFAGGAATFFYTSSWKKTFQGVFASFWLVAWTSWFVCKYQKYQRRKIWGNHIVDVNKAIMERQGKKYFVPRSVNFQLDDNEKPTQDQEKES